MKISYARLRSGVNYKGPLRNIIDSFCELHKMFIERNPKYQYGVYNFGFNKANRRRNIPCFVNTNDAINDKIS